MRRPELPSVEQRVLLAADGVRIAAGHRAAGPAGRADLAVVLAHGFTGSMGHPDVRRLAEGLAEWSAVVALDLRGHGASTGASTLGDREVLDLDAAVAWARLLGYARVATLGCSMGGSVVVRHAALSGGVEAVVAVSAPSRWWYQGTPPMRLLHLVAMSRSGRLAAQVARGTRISDQPWPPRHHPDLPLEPRAASARLSVPLLVVHGDADPFFPIDHGRELAAGPSAELWELPGFGHAEAALTPELVARIAAWISAAAPPA